ncbi:MAG: FCD domain-containing protein, partial [Proteobacteria bacterium]|nr:FCD domain-containing protein [Pseudomonadota bacterium]
NQDIHNAIVAAAHNDTLAQMHAMLRTRVRRVRYLGHGTREYWAAAMDEHEQFMAALVARDGERLAQLLQAHLANAGPRAAAVLAGEER